VDLGVLSNMTDSMLESGLAESNVRSLCPENVLFAKRLDVRA
jgi:hypothetical protein